MEDEPARPTDEHSVQADSVNLDDVLSRIRDRVDGRRRAGVYPPGFETDLDAHFQRVAGKRIASDSALVAARFNRLAAMPAFSPARIPLKSKMPGGAVVHRLIGRLVHRQTQGVLEQMQEFATDVRELLEAMVDRTSDEGKHGHSDLSDRIDMVIDRLALYDRTPLGSGQSAIGGNQNNKCLLGPLRGVKDRQHCAHHLDSSSASNNVGNRDAINTPSLQFLNERFHRPLPRRQAQVDGR